MLAAAMARAGAAGAARADARRRDLAAALQAELPRATVTIADDQVVIEGRGLSGDDALRWVAGALR